MTKWLELDVVSAESSIFQGKVKYLIATGGMGELGIHPGHTPLLTALKPGQIKVEMADGKEDVFYMSGGMLEVQPESVTVLADTALRAADLDEAAAKAAMQRAEKILSDKKSGMEYSAAMAELAEAAAQLRAIKTLRDRSGRG